MAEGLGLLDGIGKTNPYGEEWEDAEWVMSRGLRKARSGRSFEEKFNDYLDEALQVLCKKAFVLAFDDVDTNFQHGIALLEAVRKYLTSPQLVLLISGDLELYGRLVRRKNYENFGDLVMKYDQMVIDKEKKDIGKAVQELEEQYLLKIMPPQNRISMMSLSGVMQAVAPNKIKLITHKDGKAAQGDLETWVSNKIREQLLEDERTSGAHPFFELICREHLRLVIEYLRAINNEDFRGVFSVFDARLRHAGVDALQLANSSHNEALFRAFSWLVSQGNPTMLARFGVPSDASQAVVLHCFALAISKELKSSPAKSLRTLITLNLPISMMKRSGLSQDNKRTAMLKFLWGDASPDLLDVAARIGAIARSDTAEERSSKIGNLRASCFGSVGVKQKEDLSDFLNSTFGVYFEKDDNNKKRPKVTDLYNKIEHKIKTGGDKGRRSDELLKSTRSWVGALKREASISALSIEKGVVWFSLDDLGSRCGPFGAVLSLLTYDRFSDRGEKFSAISALSLLASIAKILEVDESVELYKLAISSIIPAFRPDSELAGHRLPDLNEKAMDVDDDEEVEYVDLNSLEPDSKTDAFACFQERMISWKEFAGQYTFVALESGSSEDKQSVESVVLTKHEKTLLSHNPAIKKARISAS